jgi:hypothetical protein
VRVPNLLPVSVLRCVFRAAHTGQKSSPEGARELSPGITMGKPNIRFALKGLEMRTLSGSKAQSRFLLGGPLRANWVGELSWATFSWPLRDMEWKHPSSFEPCEAKHIQCQLELPFQMGNTSQERVLGYGSSFKKAQFTQFRSFLKLTLTTLIRSTLQERVLNAG